MPGDPTDRLDQKLDAIEHTLEAQKEAMVRATSVDDIDELMAERTTGESVEVELSMVEVTTILTALEGMMSDPENPLTHIDAMELYLTLHDEHGDAIEQYVQTMNDRAESWRQQAGQDDPTYR